MKLYYSSVILLHNLFLIIVKNVLYQYLLRNFDMVDSLVFLDRFVWSVFWFFKFNSSDFAFLVNVLIL